MKPVKLRFCLFICATWLNWNCAVAKAAGYHIQLSYPGGTKTNCFYPGSGEITLNCNHSDIGVAGTVNWIYSGASRPPTSLQSSGIPHATYNKTSGTEHIVTISPVEQSLDGQTIQCQYRIGVAGLYRSDPVMVLIALGNNQDWTFDLQSNQPSGSFLINVTYINNQFCAEKFARVVVNVTQAVDVTSNTTATTLPNVVQVSNTSVNVSGLLHCVEYEGSVWVSYPGLGDTAAQSFTNRDMLYPGKPGISYTSIDNSPAATYGTLKVQRGNDCGTGYKATHYTITISVTEASSTVIQVLWPTHNNTSHCGQQMCTVRSEIPSEQDEVELVVKVTAARESEGVVNVQLITMATFANSQGESTTTLTSILEINAADTAGVATQNTPDNVTLMIILAVLVPLLVMITSVSSVVICAMAAKLRRDRRNNKGKERHKPPLYDVVTPRPTTRAVTEDDPAPAVVADQVNPSYIPLEELMMMSHMMHQQEHV